MAALTLTIDNAQWSNFQKYYLKRRPVPLDGEGQPTMTVADWIKQCTADDVYQVLLAGKQMEALEELKAVIDIAIT